MTVEELQVKITAEVSDLKQALEDVKEQLNSVSQQSNKTGKSIESMFSVAKVTAFIAVASKVISTIRQISAECVEAYTVQFNAEQKLTTAMRANLGATDAQIERVKQLASVQQSIGVVGDEVQLAGISQLSMYDLQISSIEKLLPAMNDLIVARDGLNASVGTATDMGKKFAETLNGQADSLKEVGIYFTDAEKQILQYGSEVEKVDLIVSKTDRTVGGMNSTMASTPLGQVQQLKNLWGDIQEKVGQIVANLESTLIPVLERILNWVSDILDYAIAFSEAINEVFGGKKVRIDKKLTEGTEQIKEDLSGITEGAIEAKTALYALAGFDELNILRLNDISGSGSGKGSGSGTGTGKTDNPAVDITVDDDTESTIQSITDKVNELHGLLKNLNVNVNTKEAEDQVDEFKAYWSQRLKDFLIKVETDPSSAKKEWATLKTDFERDYGKLFTSVSADTDDAGRSLSDFYNESKLNFGQIDVEIALLTDSVTKSTVAQAQKNLDSLTDGLKLKVNDVDVTLKTDDAKTAWDKFKQEVTEACDDFQATIDADPSKAEEAFAKLKQIVNESYSKFTSTIDVDADTTDGGKAIDDFKLYMDETLKDAQVNVEVLMKADDAKTALNTFKQNCIDTFDAIKKALNNSGLWKLTVEAGKLAWDTVDDHIIEGVKQTASDAGDLLSPIGAGVNILDKSIGLACNKLGIFGEDIMTTEERAALLQDALNNGADSLDGFYQSCVDASDAAQGNGNALDFLKECLINFGNPINQAKIAFGDVYKAVQELTGGYKDNSDETNKTSDSTQILGDTVFGVTGTVSDFNEKVTNATKPIKNIKDPIDKWKTASDNLNGTLDISKDKTDKNSDSIERQTGSILDQVAALERLKTALDNARESTGLFNSTYASIKQSSTSKKNCANDIMQMPSQITMPTKNEVNNTTNSNIFNKVYNNTNNKNSSTVNNKNSYTTNYSNTKNTNMSQTINNTSKDNTKDIINAIDKLGKDIDRSNQNNRTVIGDEQIAKSANRGNQRINNRAALATENILSF